MAEDARSQRQLRGINKDLEELKQAIFASDKQATAELCAAKDQLQSLHGAVRKINQERSEVRWSRTVILDTFCKLFLHTQCVNLLSFNHKAHYWIAV